MGNMWVRNGGICEGRLGRASDGGMREGDVWLFIALVGSGLSWYTDYSNEGLSVCLGRRAALSRADCEIVNKRALVLLRSKSSAGNKHIS